MKNIEVQSFSKMKLFKLFFWRPKKENFKIRILFRTPWYKSFDKEICSEYILDFLITQAKEKLQTKQPDKHPKD